MKKNRYIWTAALALVSAGLFQSCFQDMDRPDFDYPDSSVPKVYSPMKMQLPFEDDIRDKGNYGFIVRSDGNASFTDGIDGRAYLGAPDAYLLAQAPGMLTDSIAGLGSFTVAFWMKSGKIAGATGLFTIPNTAAFWGNLDIMLENNSVETQAFFKIHLFNESSGERKEQWVQTRVDDVLTGEWVHLAFRYDGAASTASVYKNGESVYTQELPGFGPLRFTDVGPLAVGAFQFSTDPYLTTGASDVTWANNYAGAFDEFRFYNEAIGEDAIRQLASR